MKCPKCGFFDPYWLPSSWDKEMEYAKVGDVHHPLLEKLKLNEIVEIDGLVYRLKPTGYYERLPSEIFRARGMQFKKAKNYWDATNFNAAHLRTANERLDSFGGDSK